MSAPANNGLLLSDLKITIIGLGLMGGSLALALKGRCARLSGVDSDPGVMKKALQQGIVDCASDDAARFLPESDMVILATPVPAILALLARLPELTPKPCMIMDLGSTKRMILERMSQLPDRFDVIGGHPLCGKEKLSLDNADGQLFNQAPFILTPLERTSDRAISAACQIISAIGAYELFIDADSHDRILAATSHLPFLLSSALVLSTPQTCAPYVSSGFRSTSRLAATPASMMIGILASNRDHVLEALARFRSSLAEIEGALLSDDAGRLADVLQKTAALHQSLTRPEG